MIKKPAIYYFLAFVLAFPALLWNLQIVPFIGDEAIRAIVALEMTISHQWIVPTINGDFYFSKPPLYNWIIIFSNYFWGGPSEWASRTPTVLFTMIFCWLIYLFHRNQYKIVQHNWLVGLMFLTCGRILFWDSFLGLIDIFYSMLTYLMFMLMYTFGKARRYTLFYFSVYTISAIGFLLKGYPSIAFLGMSLLGYFIFSKDWKKIFVPAHFISGIWGMLLIGSYFWAYDYYRDASDTVGPLLEQATRRTVLVHTPGEVLLHLISYPFENLYHFLPWSLMIVLCFRHDFIKSIRENDFIYYNFIILAANIWVYWISPEVYPRYILMLIPLSFSIFIFFYEKEKERATWRVHTLSYLLKGIILIVPFSILAGFFNPDITLINYYGWKLIILFLVMSIMSWIYFRDQPNRPIILVIVVLLLRIGFDAMVLPVRASKGDNPVCKKETLRVAEKYKNEDLFISGNSDLWYVNAFYLAQGRNKITSRKFTLEKGKFYVTDADRVNIDTSRYIIKDSFQDCEFFYCHYVITPK